MPSGKHGEVINRNLWMELDETDAKSRGSGIQCINVEMRAVVGRKGYLLDFKAMVH